MHNTIAICALGFLYFNVYQKQYDFFEKFIDESSVNYYEVMPSPLWFINIILFLIACAFVFLQLSAQLFSIVIFFEAHLAGFYAPGLIPLIISMSAVSNLIKFRSDIIQSWAACKTYVKSWIFHFTERKLLIPYFCLRFITAAMCVSLSFFSYHLAYNSIMYLLAHTEVFTVFAAIFNMPLIMTLFVSLPLILISVKTFIQCLIRIDGAIYSKLQNKEFSKSSISATDGLKLFATACIKTIAAARVSNLANSYVFCANVMNELDDLNFPEVDDDLLKSSKKAL
jgi:hypothetical protein